MRTEAAFRLLPRYRRVNFMVSSALKHLPIPHFAIVKSSSDNQQTLIGDEKGDRNGTVFKYILDGSVDVHCGGRMTQGSAGSMIVASAKRPCCLVSRGDRWLGIAVKGIDELAGELIDQRGMIFPVQRKKPLQYIAGSARRVKSAISYRHGGCELRGAAHGDGIDQFTL